MLGPEEARHHGYLDRVVALESLAQSVDEELARLRALDTASFAATKARINEQVLHAVCRGAEELGAAVAA